MFFLKACTKKYDILNLIELKQKKPQQRHQIVEAGFAIKK